LSCCRTKKQLDLFADYEAKQKEKEEETDILLREKKMQLAIFDIKKKYGKNAILRWSNQRDSRLTDQRIDLDEAAKTISDEKLRIVQGQ
jgi:DNA polymerase V